MSESGCVAFYARVSSEAQARDHTIDSQIAALKERITADGFQLGPDHCYVDDGFSGTNLLRPALERLRDAVVCGRIERIYVHAPDRLARRYAYQVPPCGVPSLLRLPPVSRFPPSLPVSSTGVFSHILMSFKMSLSTIRRATDRMSSTCGMVSKYLVRSASTTSV